MIGKKKVLEKRDFGASPLEQTLALETNYWAMKVLEIGSQVISLYVTHVTVQALIPEPVDWTSVSAGLYIFPWITCQKNKPSTSVTHVQCRHLICALNAWAGRA